MNIKQELTKLAASHYDAALARGEYFTVIDVAETLTDDLLHRFSDADRSVTRDLIALTASDAAKRVDDARTTPDPQTPLIDSLDRPVPVAEGKRVARGRMTVGDWSAHLAHIAANAARVNTNAAKENQRFTALAPYLTGDTATEQAIAAWQHDHPGEDLP